MGVKTSRWWLKELLFGASFVMVRDDVWYFTGCNESAGGETETVRVMVILRCNDED